MGELVKFDDFRKSRPVKKNTGAIPDNFDPLSELKSLMEGKELGSGLMSNRIEALLRFHDEITTAKEIRDRERRRAAMVSAAQQAYTSSLELDDPMLREKAVDAVVSVAGIARAPGIVEGWRLHYETLKRNSDKNPSPPSE